MNPAQHARLNKEKHPELYCRKCLWKTGGGDCPRHRSLQMEELRCVECGAVASDEGRCPRGVGGFHVFADFAA